MENRRVTSNEIRVTSNGKAPASPFVKGGIKGDWSLVVGYWLLVVTCHLLLVTVVYAVPYHTITVDGNLSDWAKDEIVTADENDSTFDPGAGKNEIQNLYVTWDKENLYLGIEGQTNGNGLLLYLEVDPGSGNGQENLTKINNWNRRIVFSGSATLPNGTTTQFRSDFFFGSWNGSNGNFYAFASSNAVRDISGETEQRTSQGSVKPGAEIRVPFNSLYKLGKGKIPVLSKIAVVSAIGAGDVGGDVINGISVGFGFLGGDTAPNNLNNAPITNNTSSTLNNFSVISLDVNGDGTSDNSFTNITRLELTSPVPTPVVFSPGVSGAETTTISFTLSLPSKVDVKISDIDGRHIRNLFNEAVNFSASPHKVDVVWDGKSDTGESVPMGIYIITVRAESSAGGARENAAVAVIK